MSHVLIVGDKVEFSVITKLETQYSYNVFHFVVTGVAGAGQTDVDFSNQMDAVVAPIYKTLLPTQCSYYGSKTQVIKAVRYDPVFNAANRGAGTFAGSEPLPPQLCAVANFKTGLATRSARGRMYMPAASEVDNLATALPSAAYLAAWVNLFTTVNGVTAIATGGNSASISWGVYSRKLDSMFPITTFSMRPAWGTMRKRSMISHADAAPF